MSDKTPQSSGEQGERAAGRPFDIQWLLKPDFSSMTQEHRLVRVAMLAYLKLSPICDLDNMTEAQVSDALQCEICNTIGDDAYCVWLESRGLE